MSFLEIEGLHAFVTGAAGGIGQAIVQELLSQGCKVSAHDLLPNPLQSSTKLHFLQGDISSEPSIVESIRQAVAHFGPINILCANAGITDESADYPIWDMPSEIWDRTYAVNVRGTFLTIKHFLRAAQSSQRDLGHELDHLAIVVTGSECGKFGQAGHAEYASGKAGLQYGLVRSVKNEVVRLNGRARVNAVAPGWVDTKLIEGRLDDPREMFVEAQATVPLKKIAKPQDVARMVAFLASNRAAGHISGECISVDGGMEGRMVWREEEVLGTKNKETASSSSTTKTVPSLIAKSISTPSKPKKSIKILISVDFDAVSGWLGTGASPENNMADYSSGFFAANVGVRRLLNVFKKAGIADKTTWFIPGHSLESFPEQTKEILDTGCELGLHGYCHEGAPQLTTSQEAEVLTKCITLATSLTGKPPLGYRAPLYQLRPSTISLLESHSFLYDTSLSYHDSRPQHLLHRAAISPPDFAPGRSAEEWMKPLPSPERPTKDTLVEIPCNWYMEDMTPLQYWPHTVNSQGYVDVGVVEGMWRSRFEELRGEMEEDGEEGDMVVFPLVLHPDTSGMAHVIGMVRRMIDWLKRHGEEVEFMTFGECARRWKEANGV
ncbi:polysaccharide deacetylase family protein-like protein [Aulographum hederae CBS 113979]|uniref:Polysaccharide deacetylase family protein-like protein n=1 Tax=Aulographum hederae CBS 113979 TaxID=1176131 RepID=A0A6G1GQJ1_9PEZI|nr:polysaccharide deacetylase family protein-like protein [Aulographum hederae CBS 113979]